MGRAMSISPPSDLILDVMKAADPQKMREAASQLRSIAAARAANADALGGKWGESFRLAGMSPDARGAPAIAPEPVGTSATGARGAAASDAAGGGPGRLSALERKSAPAAGKMRKSFGELEGVVLENMLNGMLGGSGSEVFGKGLAGEYWRSLMARAIASQVAHRGGMGLAEALVRRAGGPDGPAGAANALGVSQRMEKAFLDTLDSEAVTGKRDKEVS